jgi:hypothetical protein
MDAKMENVYIHTYIYIYIPKSFQKTEYTRSTHCILLPSEHHMHKYMLSMYVFIYLCLYIYVVRKALHNAYILYTYTYVYTYICIYTFLSNVYIYIYIYIHMRPTKTSWMPRDCSSCPGWHHATHPVAAQKIQCGHWCGNVSPPSFPPLFYTHTKIKTHTHHFARAKINTKTKIETKTNSKRQKFTCSLFLWHSLS